MRFTTTTSALADLQTGCLIGSFKVLSRIAGKIGARDTFAAVSGDFEDKPGQTLLIRLGGGKRIQRLLVVGGLNGTLEPARFRKACQSAAAALKPVKAASAVWALTQTRVSGQDVAWKAWTGLSALANTFYS